MPDVMGDFVLTTTVTTKPQQRFDQAGARCTHWVRASGQLAAMRAWQLVCAEAHSCISSSGTSSGRSLDTSSGTPWSTCIYLAVAEQAGVSLQYAQHQHHQLQKAAGSQPGEAACLEPPPDCGHNYLKPNHSSTTWSMLYKLHTYPTSHFRPPGLMVQCSPSCWLKTSVESGAPGQPSQLGVVVTNGGFSDWSTQDFPSSIHTVSKAEQCRAVPSGFPSWVYVLLDGRTVYGQWEHHQELSSGRCGWAPPAQAAAGSSHSKPTVLLCPTCILASWG